MIQIDMPMPTNCYDCWIRQNMGCRIANESGWLNDRRADDCPLKTQEPVMVEERAGTNTINCPKCGQQFARVGRDESIYLDTDEEPNYCPKCGQAVKWE